MGFSDMLIPNMTSILKYEACVSVRPFCQDVVTIYHDHFSVFLVILLLFEFYGRA